MGGSVSGWMQLAEAERERRIAYGNGRALMAMDEADRDRFVADMRERLGCEQADAKIAAMKAALREGISDA